MTLIVARHIENDVYIIGDSKFTENIKSPRENPKSYIGGLKIIILTPGLCIAFAGNVEHARNAIQGIYDTEVNLFDKNCVIDHFLKHHNNSQSSGHPTDFIVAGICENEEKLSEFIKEVFKISDSHVSRENEATYIGDYDAFNSFQEACHKRNAKRNTPTLAIFKLGNTERPNFDYSHKAAAYGMQAVIDDTNISNVDGIYVTVISEENQFKYVQYTQVRGSPTAVNNLPFSPLTFGGAAEGSDIKQCGIYGEVGIGVFAVYWITGNFGVIHNPEKSFEPSIISNCTQDDFRRLVEEQVSIAHGRAVNYQSRFF